MEEELKYSDNALLNIDLFFNNEINFYIEDRGKEYRYETILKELFNVRIESIFALDGKNNLKKKFRELKNNKKLKDSFFIADLDFDYILKKDWIEDQHFIYLERYEIENYIIDKNALIHFFKDELCCREVEAEKRLNYDYWVKQTSERLYRLFLLYLIVQEENLNIENTSENPNKYFLENGNVCISEIDKYYEKLKKELEKNDENIDEKIENMLKKVKIICGENWSNIIKGKYYIVGLRKYLSDLLGKESQKKRKINEKLLLDYLFNFFDKKPLFFIKNRVEECLKKELSSM